MKNQRLTILAVVSACLLALFGCAPSDSGGGGGSSNQASLQPSNQEEEAFNIARGTSPILHPYPHAILKI